MRTYVMRLSRLRLVRSAALLSVAALATGCSADAVRFQDGFYTGAVPQAPVANTQVAGNYGSAASVQPSNPSYGSPVDNQTYASAATPSVSRSQLPPPPASSYSSGGYSAQPSEDAIASAPRESGAGIPAQQIASTGAAQAAAPRGYRAPSASGSVTVESGDSLIGIARRTGVSVADLRAENGLSDDNIRIGQTLKVPAGGSAPTRVASLGAAPTTLQQQASGVSASSAVPQSAPSRPSHSAASAPAQAEPVRTAASPAITQATPPDAEPVQSKPSAAGSVAVAPAATTIDKEETKEVASIAPASTGISQFRWPVQGRVVKSFGDKVGSRRNDGLEISVPRGTPVKAAENGVVIYAGEGLKEFGKTVLVKHDNGLVTVYGYNDDITVQRGETVKRGQEIAKAGMTGQAETPMVHFEVRKDSSPVNPMTYLQ